MKTTSTENVLEPAAGAFPTNGAEAGASLKLRPN